MGEYTKLSGRVQRIWKRLGKKASKIKTSRIIVDSKEREVFEEDLGMIRIKKQIKLATIDVVVG